MKIERLEFNLFGVNTYVVWDTDILEAAVIDPGMENADECAQFAQFVELNRLQITSLINTHLHIDHTMGNEYVEDAYGVGLTAHADDEFLGKARAQQASMFHLRNAPLSPLKIDVPVKEGDILKVGNSTLKVLEVPGHSPGSIALYSAKDGFVITGDALFKGSIGRTDLPGGDYGTLIRSINNKLLTLPDDTVVYPGHGDATTIAAEKAANPFIG